MYGLYVFVYIRDKTKGKNNIYMNKAKIKWEKMLIYDLSL